MVVVKFLYTALFLYTTFCTPPCFCTPPPVHRLVSVHHLLYTALFLYTTSCTPPCFCTPPPVHRLVSVHHLLYTALFLYTTSCTPPCFCAPPPVHRLVSVHHLLYTALFLCTTSCTPHCFCAPPPVHRLAVEASASRAAHSSSIPVFPMYLFPGTPVTTCQAPGIVLVQRSWACFTWKGAQEIKSWLLLLSLLKKSMRESCGGGMLFAFCARRLTCSYANLTPEEMFGKECFTRVTPVWELYR